MHVHYLQHVPFEGLGSIEAHLSSRRHRVSRTRLYAGDWLPDAGAIDWLIVMGGPMGVHDDALHPWLAAEKRFIRTCIDAGMPVLGICLGAQLIAAVLGARVYANPQREIGWFPIRRSAAAERSPLGAVFPEQADVFHWHGDTFELPAGAIPLASSAACAHQGFIYEDRVLALQFHLETTPASAQALIAHCGHELDGSAYVQDAETMLADAQRFTRINGVMAGVLDALAREPAPQPAQPEVQR